MPGGEVTIASADGLEISRTETQNWVIYRFIGSGTFSRKGLDDVLHAFVRDVEGVDKSVCFVPESIQQPNSRALGALIGLLTKSNGESRRVSLVTQSVAWGDMLDIMGVRESFIELDSVDELTSAD